MKPMKINLSLRLLPGFNDLANQLLAIKEKVNKNLFRNPAKNFINRRYANKIRVINNRTIVVSIVCNKVSKGEKVSKGDDT
jgi:hypothetical protein